MRAAHPDLDAANVINRITATATSPGVAVPSPIYGYGLVDAAAAVNADVPLVTTGPAQELKDWIHLHRRAELGPPPPPPRTPPPAAPPPPPPRARPPPTTAAPTPAPQAAPQTPLGTLLPTVAQLRDVGIPLLVYGVFLGLVVVWAVQLVRRVRGSRRS